MIVKYLDKVRKLEGEVKAILKQEEEEKQLRLSEMEVNKARNLVEHEAEIHIQPPSQDVDTGDRKEGGGAGSSALTQQESKKRGNQEKDLQKS